MSRIGKKPIIIPQEVVVKIDNGKIDVKGPKGELFLEVPARFKVIMEEKEGQKMILLEPTEEGKDISALWGLYRKLVFNLVEGVVKGFEKSLKIEGVGYRAECKGDKLVLNVGFSHTIELQAPPGIAFSVQKDVITVSGIDKQLVGQIAADVRACRKPEPYKGTGIRYIDEVIKRKAGKKAIGSE